MELFINNKSGAPIYDQIYNQIKQQRHYHQARLR